MTGTSPRTMTARRGIHLDTLRDAIHTPEAPTQTMSRGHSRYGRFVKPGIDWLGALLLCLVLVPVFAAVAVVLLATLGRPLLIRQRRVGRNGRVFGMYKFRTMHPCRRKERRPVPSEADRRRRHKTPDDPRHTDVGRFLRRYSLDEFPQLWNVLRGEMSLVGPRPELELVVSGYAAWQHQRHQVKPGVTGLWQVTERASSNGNMHLHTEVDLAYLEQISLRTDLGILLRTPLAALGKGS
jgi:lipopolysaccharide/colanic/teichoic acid biosynthesis glycosyltransferase